MCLLVREDSDVVKCLQVGDTLDMKYYTSDASLPPENLTTQIKHVTKEDEGRFQGHYLVGLYILENQESRES
jgi:predicted transglutaminase-like protease